MAIEVIVADIDGDGRMDVVSGSRWYRAPDWEPTALPGVAQAIAVMDVDGDGCLEIIGTRWPDLTSRLCWATRDTDAWVTQHRRVQDGTIGDLVLARSRYGWSGPWWGKWFYERGGGALFDLGVYNLTSLCGFFGSVRRVTALVGTASPERVVEGATISVQSEDNAHVLLDFGGSRFGSVTTGFTMQKYRSPAIELYGTEGVLQLMGDDWAPQGFEQYQNSAGVWEVFPEMDPTWPWTDGLRHLVDCIESAVPTVTRPEHAYHALEVMLAATRSTQEGRFVDIESTFPELDHSSLAPLAEDDRRIHDPRTLV